MKAIAEARTPLSVFDQMESEVRSYCRSFPVVFTRASGHTIWDRSGKAYIDFFAGAGALNYGHNDPAIKRKLIDYLAKDGLTHSLDMATEAKEALLKAFEEKILKPRGLSYKVMFPGPTGTNSVEAALKLARKATGRETVMSFTNGFHGMTIGSLSVTGNRMKRRGAGMPLTHTLALPYDQYMGSELDTTLYIERLLEDDGSGVSLPAAMILETVQGEGGIHVASIPWLQKIEGICRKHDILLIVDDVQMGCGRTGTFFSFEEAGIQPDIVCLSKSIGGYGLPLALTLIKPELDLWLPGEHNGTFRGNNLAFVAATESLRYWENDQLCRTVLEKGSIVRTRLEKLQREYPYLQGKVRGRGLMQGLAVGVDGLAEKICAEAFERGLILETSGPKSEVMKVMPPLTITEEALLAGLDILEASIKACKEEEKQ
ncbi:diaminobutyrate--2-oxoglutarate transaminase [Brevibacillus choshinensis]|uniref:Diaminobutyrate--2-oxoglutarate transaminase n=1 Tax=Brevibacillus choshinensis TaxID=54911 RepID=A0ABX7FLD1_BRECH|nr:diaminobutyrate--2-oxoglutarate transaminase [Brevibacillus choshinensis]QRG66645.1 diaminobutyrate--2-oxoglutarate transaminase [Brevibacillus choshinensis]